MRFNKQTITISVENMLLDLIEKDEVKRILGNRSAFLNQLIRKHYGFPSSLHWNYSDEFKKEIEESKKNFLERIEKEYSKE